MIVNIAILTLNFSLFIASSWLKLGGRHKRLLKIASYITSNRGGPIRRGAPKVILCVISQFEIVVVRI